MEKSLFSTVALTVEDGAEEAFELEYYIVKSTSDDGLQNVGKACYGVEVVKIMRCDGIKYTETKSARKLCSSQGEAHGLARLLSRLTVTPVTLECVIEDLAYTTRTKGSTA